MKSWLPRQYGIILIVRKTLVYYKNEKLLNLKDFSVQKQAISATIIRRYVALNKEYIFKSKS